MGRNSRKEVAQDALIEAAERIFGREGIENASLRAIAIEAGSANSYAVQYHFGDRAGLVQAIFDRRLAEVEARRAVLKSALPESPSIRQLLDLICRPLFEQRDSAGRHSYAAFLLGLRRSPEGFRRRHAVSAQAVLAAWAAEQIRLALPEIDAALFDFRLNTVSALLLDALDRLDAEDDHAVMLDELLARILDMGEAILRAPIHI